MPRPRPYKIAAHVNRVLPNFPIYYNKDAKLSVEDRFQVHQEDARALDDEIRQLHFNIRVVSCAEVLEQEKHRDKREKVMKQELLEARKCLLKVRQHQLKVLLESELKEFDKQLRDKGLTIRRDRM